MTQHVKQLIAEARKLAPDERAELLDTLLVELREPTEAWAEAWTAEADRRWARYVSGTEQSHEADEVLAAAKAGLARRRAT